LQSKGLGRWWYLAGWRDRRRYRRLRIRRRSDEGRFLTWSRWKARAQMVLLAAILGLWGESAWWATQNSLPFGYVLSKPLWALGLYAPLPDMVDIPAGTFTMGCVAKRDDGVEGGCNEIEKPAHEVTINQPFAMGKHEVTFLQYDYYVWSQRRRDTKVDYPPDESWGRFDRPVINVSWDDAKAYARWLSDKTGQPYRLPTEAEWEYAARAGTATAYWWGKEFGENNANCDYHGRSVPVGSFRASPWGLYDTVGNVYEWVEDAYHDSHEGAPSDRSAWEAGGDAVSRVLRGGSWYYEPGSCRAANRYSFAPDYRGDGAR